MISQTWASHGVGVNVLGNGVSVSAQKDDAGTVQIRISSSQDGVVSLVVGGKPLDGTFTVTTLAGGADTNDANSPGDPMHISPVTAQTAISGGALTVTVNSFTVVSVPASSWK